MAALIVLCFQRGLFSLTTTGTLVRLCVVDLGNWHVATSKVQSEMEELAQRV